MITHWCTPRGYTKGGLKLPWTNGVLATVYTSSPVNALIAIGEVHGKVFAFDMRAPNVDVVRGKVDPSAITWYSSVDEAIVRGMLQIDQSMAFRTLRHSVSITGYTEYGAIKLEYIKHLMENYNVARNKVHDRGHVHGRVGSKKARPRRK